MSNKHRWSRKYPSSRSNQPNTATSTIASHAQLSPTNANSAQMLPIAALKIARIAREPSVTSACPGSIESSIYVCPKTLAYYHRQNVPPVILKEFA